MGKRWMTCNVCNTRYWRSLPDLDCDCGGVVSPGRGLTLTDEEIDEAAMYAAVRVLGSNKAESRRRPIECYTTAEERAANGWDGFAVRTPQGDIRLEW